VQKVIELLLRLRLMNDKGHYVLNQTSIIGLMETQWGEGTSADTITENDKLRFFGLTKC